MLFLWQTIDVLPPTIIVGEPETRMGAVHGTASRDSDPVPTNHKLCNPHFRQTSASGHRFPSEPPPKYTALKASCFRAVGNPTAETNIPDK